MEHCLGLAGYRVLETLCVSQATCVQTKSLDKTRLDGKPERTLETGREDQRKTGKTSDWAER